MYLKMGENCFYDTCLQAVRQEKIGWKAENEDLWDKYVIARQCAYYSALRAACGGCAMYTPAGVVARNDIRGF